MLKPREGESLQDKRPDLLADWDYEKNDVTPDMVSFGARKLIHWKCHKCGFEWVTSANRRTTNKVPGMGCRICGQKVRLAKCKETRKKNSLVPKTFNCKLTKFVEKIPENILKCPDCRHTWTIDSSQVEPYTDIKCPCCTKLIEDIEGNKGTEDEVLEDAKDNVANIEGNDTQ